VRTSLLVVLAVLAACQSPPNGVPDAAVPDFDAAGDGVLLARLESFPGGGLELTVRLEDADGRPLMDDEGAQLSMRWLDEQTPHANAVRRAPLTEPGYTLVLLMPGADAAAHAAQVEAVRAFVMGRPQGERIALYRWLDHVEQVANYDDDRERLLVMLEQLEPRPADAVLALPAIALRDVVGSVFGVGGEAPRAMRAAVIVADHLPGPAPDGAGHSAVVLWVVPGLGSEDVQQLGAGRVAASLEDAAAVVADFAAEAFYDVAVCGASVGDRPAVVSLSQERGELSLVVPPHLPESAGEVCDEAAILAGGRAYPDRVELVFDTAQRAVYEDRVAGNSKADFDVSIRFAADQPPVEASAHLRGKGSIGCERKNYTVNIKGPRPRYLMPGSATDEFYLISMCLDNRYVRAHTAYSLYAEYGLFPVKFRYIEVLLDGETRGVYMFVEKPAEEMVRDNGRVRSVLRRRFNAGDDRTLAEVKYSRSGDVDAVAAFDALLTDIAGLAGAELEAALQDRLDLDGYLRMLAFNSLLHNGDNVDEVWLMSSDRLRADGGVGDWFTFMAWDPDDVFAGCHYSGNLAFPDAFAISYCAEAELDDLILGDPVLYRRYATALEELMLDVTGERFRAELDVTRDALLQYMRRPGIAAAMVKLIEANPDAADPEVAEAEVLGALDSLQSAFEQRAALLRSRLDDYWEASGQ